MSPRVIHLGMALMLVAGCGGGTSKPKADPAGPVETSSVGKKADEDFLAQAAPGMGDVKDVSFSPDGATIVVASGNVFKGDVQTFDAKTGKVIHSFPGGYGCAAFNADGTLLAAAGKDCLMIWDTATGKVRVTIPGYDAMITRVAFSPDGQSLATSSYDGTVQVWTVATGKRLHVLQGPTKQKQSNWVLDVAWSKDGKRLAAAGPSEAIVVWDPQSGKAVHELRQPNVASSVPFTPDGKLLASISGTKDSPREIRLWDIESGREVRTLAWGSGPAQCVAFSPDGTRLVAVNNDGEVRSWDTRSWEVRNTFPAHGQMIWKLAFAPGGKVFATASADGTVRIWDGVKLEPKKE